MKTNTYKIVTVSSIEVTADNPVNALKKCTAEYRGFRSKLVQQDIFDTTNKEKPKWIRRTR